MNFPSSLQRLYDNVLRSLFAVPDCGTCPSRFLPLAERMPVPLHTVSDAPSQPGSAKASAETTGRPFPVDVVYTWVDGADPQLAAKRNAYLPERDKRSADSTGAALYRDNDELRYSLRSLARYAPWVRKIWIATDAQVPAWLDTAHPRIRVADHRDFLPADCLPTFNSRVIEAHLHRIPGLAERYLYCNDDFFLAAPCTPGHFFTPNSLPHIFVDWRSSRRYAYRKQNSPHACSHANVRAWLKAAGMTPVPDLITPHAPYPQTLSNAAAAYAFFERAIADSRRNKFRTSTEMAFNCHAASLWAYAHKRGVPCDMPHFYINPKAFNALPRYDALVRQQGQPFVPPFFCLNDVGDAPWPPGRREAMTALLQTLYPAPSPFERAVPAGAC